MRTHVQTDTDITDLLDSISSNRHRWKLILFNDDHTPMDVVVIALLRALKCTPERALSMMLYAHENGQATILIDSYQTVQQAEAILSAVPLQTDLQPAGADDQVNG